MKMPVKQGSIDLQIGWCIRALRIAKGWSQEDLAGKVNLSFQQIQKYESGQSRILASKLVEFANALGADISYFYDGLPETAGDEGKSDGPKFFEDDTWKLASDFDRIKNVETRKHILNLVSGIYKEQN